MMFTHEVKKICLQSQMLVCNIPKIGLRKKHGNWSALFFSTQSYHVYATMCCYNHQRKMPAFIMLILWHLCTWPISIHGDLLPSRHPSRCVVMVIGKAQIEPIRAVDLYVKRKYLNSTKDHNIAWSSPYKICSIFFLYCFLCADQTMIIHLRDDNLSLSFLVSR